MFCGILRRANRSIARFPSEDAGFGRLQGRTELLMSLSSIEQRIALVQMPWVLFHSPQLRWEF